jgi:hypothetical protein
MREEHREKDESKGIFYEGLEAFAREKIRQHLQDLLEQEVTEWLGRAKSERKMNPSEQSGLTNRSDPSGRARTRDQGAGAEASRAVHPQSARGRTVAGEAHGEQRVGKTAPARGRKARGRSGTDVQRDRGRQASGHGAAQ